MNEEIEKLKQEYKVHPDKGTKIYTRKQVEKFKARALIDNAELEPYSEFRNSERGDLCHTCGTRDMMHPQTAYCFICDTDNW